MSTYNRIVFAVTTLAVAALTACGEAPAAPQPKDAPQPDQCGWPAVAVVVAPEDPAVGCYRATVSDPSTVVMHDIDRVLCDVDLSYDGGVCYLHGCHEMLNVPPGTQLIVWGTPPDPNYLVTFQPQENCEF